MRWEQPECSAHCAFGWRRRVIRKTDRRPTKLGAATILTGSRSSVSISKSPLGRLDRAERQLREAGGRVRSISSSTRYRCLTRGCPVAALDLAAAMMHAATSSHVVEGRSTYVEHFGDPFASEQIRTEGQR